MLDNPKRKTFDHDNLFFECKRERERDEWIFLKKSNFPFHVGNRNRFERKDRILLLLEERYIRFSTARKHAQRFHEKGTKIFSMGLPLSVLNGETSLKVVVRIADVKVVKSSRSAVSHSDPTHLQTDKNIFSSNNNGLDERKEILFSSPPKRGFF